MPKSPKPVTMGRIINYVHSAEAKKDAVIYPAVVVRTASTDTDDKVSAQVFLDQPSVFFRKDIPYSEAKESGTWHWPEIK